MQRPWYKRKLVWALLLLSVLFLLSRLEFAKFRYDQETLAEFVLEKSGMVPHFDIRQVEKRTINYIHVGDRPDLPLIIFVHGSPGALNAYQDYFSDPELLKLADMIALDRPGFGYSNFGQTEPSLAFQAAAIAAIVEDHPDRKKLLVGHSMGGPIIAKFAMTYPESTDALLMIAPSISPYLEPSNSWRKVLNFPLIRWFTPPSLKVCNQEIIPLKEELEGMMDEWKNIEAPLVVIQGEADRLVPKGNADFAKKMMPPETPIKIMMLPEKNHFILWSEIPMIMEEIRGLLRGE